MMLYRDRYYNPSGDTLAEIAVKKNRNGGTGVARLKFTPEYSLFEDVENDFGGAYVGSVPNDY